MTVAASPLRAGVLELFGLGRRRRLRQGEHEGESDGQLHGASLITCDAIGAVRRAILDRRSSDRYAAAANVRADPSSARAASTGGAIGER